MKLDSEQAKQLAKELVYAADEADDHGSPMPVSLSFMPETIMVIPHADTAYRSAMSDLVEQLKNDG